jgi:5-methyltetrahydropteroyltriglutamate--homocysteine methyltransferase
MKRSTTRILTSHAGSLPRPQPLLDVNRAKMTGEGFDERLYAERLAAAVEEICRTQKELGVDIVNEGEFGKASIGAIDYGPWASYVWRRLSGWDYAAPGQVAIMAGRRDRIEFADFYRELDGTGFISSNSLIPRQPVITGPISYVGHDAVRADLANLKAGIAKAGAEEGFVTSIAPGNFSRRQNLHYKTEEDMLIAVGEALREEYKAIIDAGFVLQLDDPGLPSAWDFSPAETTVADYRKTAMRRVEELNHTLRGLPKDRIRYHICWGSWHGPHASDLPLKDIVEVMLKVHAGAFSIEAANVRHEHEWKIWRDVKLPEGAILMPGVVSHATNVIEHPDLVADRILRFASLVGRENVIAGTDCGLGGRIHVQLVWAKLRALAEGAAIASRALWA